MRYLIVLLIFLYAGCEKIESSKEKASVDIINRGNASLVLKKATSAIVNCKYIVVRYDLFSKSFKKNNGKAFAAEYDFEIWQGSKLIKRDSDFFIDPIVGNSVKNRQLIKFNSLITKIVLKYPENTFTLKLLIKDNTNLINCVLEEKGNKSLLINNLLVKVEEIKKLKLSIVLKNIHFKSKRIKLSMKYLDGNGHVIEDRPNRVKHPRYPVGFIKELIDIEPIDLNFTIDRYVIPYSILTEYPLKTKMVKIEGHGIKFFVNLTIECLKNQLFSLIHLIYFFVLWDRGD